MHRKRVIALTILTLAVATVGCTSVRSYRPHLPWGHKAAPVPQPIRELEVAVSADTAPPVVLQFWERNTLVVDLQDAASVGKISLSRREGKAWPARIAFRMSPTRFEVLEVKGAQRVVLPVANGGTTPVTVEIPVKTYDKTTAALVVSWGVRSSF
jgi:hypothetical protein